jgi:hypothetical protein
MYTELEPHVRGDFFQYSFALGNDWLGVYFDDVKFTLRRKAPSSFRRSDNDTVDQASVDSGEITFDVDENENGTIEIISKRTRTWPTGLLYWDLQGSVGPRVYTIDRGTIKILFDVTRSD